MFRKIIFGCTLFFMVIFLAFPAAAAEPIKVFVNDQELAPDPPPFVRGGRTMLPIRAVLEPLGAQLGWDAKTQTVSVFKGTSRVNLVINRKEASVNGVKYPLDTPAIINSGRTFVPIRFVAEAFNCLVNWNGAEKTVRIFQNAVAGGRKMVVTGYYYDARSLESLQTNPNLITDTIHYSYRLNSEGRVEEKPFFEQGFSFARQNAMGVEMLAFANDREQLKNLLDNTNQQQVVIEDICAFLSARGFDGVNMDFEYIDRAQAVEYVNFIKALRDRMGPQYSLSISVPARAGDREWWYDGYDYAGLASVADRVMVMAYDQHYAGGDPGPVAGNDWTEQVINYLLPMIPKEKFQLGLGIYGYDWPQGGKGKSIYIQAARDLAAAKGTEIQSDAASGVSWFSYTDESGIVHQVWFEDTASVQTKLELVKKYQLSGVALWRLGIIPPDIWDMISRYK